MTEKPWTIPYDDWMRALEKQRPNYVCDPSVQGATAKAVSRAEAISHLLGEELGDIPHQEMIGGDIYALSYPEKYAMIVREALRQGKDVPDDIRRDYEQARERFELTDERVAAMYDLQERFSRL